MNTERAMLWMLVFGLLGYHALPVARADGPTAPSGTVCDKFAPAMGVLPKEKVEEFITAQVAAGRSRVTSVSTGTTTQVLICAW